MPWWAGLSAVVMLAVLAVLAFLQSGLRQTVGAVARYAIVTTVLILAAIVVERFVERDHVAARRALDVRIGELTLRAIAPGSPLACLDATAGEAVETSCEKALFASPETIATAVSYVSARLSLLADFAEFEKTNKTATGGYGNNLVFNLRRAIEADRFGFVAHLLSYRDNCTPAVCDAFSLMRDTSRVAGNMRERTFDLLVERHAAIWPGRGETSENPTLSAAPASSSPTTSASASNPPATPAPAVTNYDFPSASSIPPVSIMNAEPSGPAPTASEEPERSTPARKPAPVASRRSGQKPGAPVPITPHSAPAAANTQPASAVR